MPDETVASSSEATEEKTVQDESLKASEAATETAEGDESQSPKQIPYDRFKQVNDEKKTAQGIVDWYRSYIGNPNDVVAFKKWQQAQVEKAKEAEEEGDISPKELERIRKVMRKADPEYAEYIERHKQDEANRSEAQFDEAEDQVRELSAKAGLPKDENTIRRIGRQVMLEIREDEKLARMWNAGNMACVAKAFRVIEDNFIAPLRKSTSSPARVAEEKRRISRLPTLSGGGTALSQQGQPKREKGIGKQAHEEAWTIMQRAFND